MKNIDGNVYQQQTDIMTKPLSYLLGNYFLKRSGLWSTKLACIDIHAQCVHAVKWLCHHITLLLRDAVALYFFTYMLPLLWCTGETSSMPC